MDAELESNLHEQQLERCHQYHPDVAGGHVVPLVPAQICFEHQYRKPNTQQPE